MSSWPPNSAPSSPEYGSTISAGDLLLDHRFAVEGHGGASPGAQTLVAFDSTHRTTVAVWCNRLDPGDEELLPSVEAARQAFELVTPASAR